MHHLKTLDPQIARKLLGNRKSLLESEAERAENEREDILSRTCPDCGTNLVPRLPTDPSKIFRGTKIVQLAWCPNCQRDIR